MTNKISDFFDIDSLNLDNIKYLHETFCESGVPPHKITMLYAPNNSTMTYYCADKMVRILQALFSHAQFDISQCDQYKSSDHSEDIIISQDSIILQLTYNTGNTNIVALGISDKKEGFSRH